MAGGRERDGRPIPAAWVAGGEGCAGREHEWLKADLVEGSGWSGVVRNDSSAAKQREAVGALIGGEFQ